MSPHSRNPDWSASQAPALAHRSATASSDTQATVTLQQAGPNAEIEIKLLCDPDQLAKIIASPEVARYARSERKHIDLKAIYYDTAKFDLHKSGSVLRVRTDGKRFVMTMKSRKKGNGKALERTERKASVESIETDLAVLSQFLTAETFARIGNEPFIPVFSTEMQRHTRMLHTPHGTVELAADQGRIVAGESSENISEIELELMDGSTEALFQLAQQLVSSFHLRPSIRSKAARGFDLALGKPPQITKARDLTFDDGTTVSGALDDILRSAIQHLLENQPAAEDGRDPEGIHQYRVALRRLRSILGLIRSLAPSSPLDAFRNDAKWLMSNLNDARDWDVFVTQTLSTIAQACPSIDGFDIMGQAAQKQREMAHDKARDAITDPRTGQFQIALGLWVEQRGWLKGAPQEGLALLKGPARAFAVQILDKLHAKALKRGRHFKKLEPEERHKLRIAIKKLRYASDFFLPLLGHAKRNRRYAKSLSALQDRLGGYNDVAVTERLVRPLMESKLPLAQTAGALIGWQAGHLSRDGGDLVAAWKKFRSRDPLD